MRPHYGLITDRYTLVHFYKPAAADKDQAELAAIPNDYWELFDRQKDPGEMRSVFGEPAYAEVQSKLMNEVSRQQRQLKIPSQDDPKAFGSSDFWPVSDPQAPK